MKLIRKYKWFILGLFILFLILVLWICKDIFISTEGPLYGHRLEGIEDVSITSDNKKNASSFLLETSGVKKADISVHGKIVSIVILVDETITVDKVKEISTSVLDKFSKDQKQFYDFSFLIDYANDTKATTFPIVGYKNKNKDNIVW